MNLAKLKKSFLPDNINRRLFPFFVALLIGFIGMGVGIFAEAQSWPVLAFFSFMAVAFAVFFGFSWVMWLTWSRFFHGGWRKDHQASLDGLKAKQPWE